MNDPTREEARVFVQHCKEKYEAVRAAEIAVLTTTTAYQLLDELLNRHVDDKHFTGQDWNDVDRVQGWIAQQAEEAAQ